MRAPDELALLDAASAAHRFARARVRVDGDTFDPLTIPYLIELYDVVRPKVVIQKAAQLGVTAWAILTVIERMRRGVYTRGVLYGFPTQDEVYDFAQSRFDRILRDNAMFFAGAVKDTDRTELKQIGEAMLYFRGIHVPDKKKRPSKLLSIPVDCLVLDEHDDMDKFAREVVRSRLDSSLLRHEILLGHPTLPGWGINTEFEEGDQRYWHIRCEACNEWTCLEEEFPNCLGRVKGGEWFRCCKKCRKAIDARAGEWVPKHPGRKVWSYLMSQLMSTRKPVDVVVAAYEKMQLGAVDEAGFWNLVMARPFASRDDALDQAHVLSLFDAQKPEELSHLGPSFLGADVGKRSIHVDIGTLTSADRGHLHWIGEVATFDELYDLGKRHNVSTGVIDAMAESRSVADFVKRASWAWGCHYTETPLTEYDWRSSDRIVRVGRTPSLDASHRAILQRRLTFRRINAYAEQVFVPHLVNLVRVRTMHDKTGQVKFSWHVLDGATKNDHHRHGVNYAWIASTATGIARAVRAKTRGGDDYKPSWQTA